MSTVDNQGVLCVAVAARQGVRIIQKHTWTEFSPETTLRAVGKSLFPDGDLLHVEACKEMGGEVSEFAGSLLDRTVGFVVDRARLQYLKYCYATEHIDTQLHGSKDGKKRNQLAFQAMMEDKRRCQQYHWPAPYNETASKTAVRQIANRIIATGLANPTEHGGFSSSSLAESSRPHIFSLAQVLFSLVPHANALANRGLGIPQLFLDAAEEPWINSTAAPKAEPDPADEQASASYHDQLEEHARKLRSIAGQSGFIADSMRMSVHVSTLADNVANYRTYLIKNAVRRKPSAHYQTSEQPLQREYDKDYHCISLDERPCPAIVTSEQAATIDRIKDQLLNVGPYHPVRIDKLLLDESEHADAKKRTTNINHCLKFILNRARLELNVQVYRYHIGQHFGTHNYLWLLPDGDSKHQWESCSLRTLNRLKADLPRHLSRKYHSFVASRYSNVSQMTASLRRDVLRVVCGDNSVGSHGDADKARDARLQLWMEADAELADEIIVDMRKLNKSASHYDRFWEVMAKFLEEHDMKVLCSILIH